MMIVTWNLCAGSKDHIKVQGEILEGLVARMVSHESSKHMQKVLEEFPAVPDNEGGMVLLPLFLFFDAFPLATFIYCFIPCFVLGGLDLGPSLREICAANRSDEKQVTKIPWHEIQWFGLLIFHFVSYWNRNGMIFIEMDQNWHHFKNFSLSYLVSNWKSLCNHL